MSIFDTIFVQPFLNLFVLIYHQLVVLHIPYAVGFSIIVLTVIVRLLLYPLMARSLKQQKKMQLLTPQIAKIKEKYKTDMKAQQMAQMALFKAEGVNPASGCFLLLLQLPVLISLYTVLLKVVQDKTIGGINKYLYSEGLKLKDMWDIHFFGLSLGAKPSDMMAQVGVGILLVAVITGGLQLIQSKMMAQPKSKAVALPAKTGQPDFASTFQTQMLYLLPVMVGFFAYTLPFGLSLYWNTLTIFGIIQQYLVSGWGGLVDWLPFLAKKEESKYK